MSGALDVIGVQFGSPPRDGGGVPLAKVAARAAQSMKARSEIDTIPGVDDRQA
jgi:hypothetical protein